VQRGHIQDLVWDILDFDSSPIGTITASGLSRGPRAPGAPADVTLDALTITGGTGAFFGIRGQAGLVDLGSPRQATFIEAPANRRVLGGAKRSYLLQVIPMTTPEVAMTSSGPAVVHADSTFVSAARPAKAGEVITIYALGLGPTRGTIPFGTAFPQSPALVVARRCGERLASRNPLYRRLSRVDRCVSDQSSPAGRTGSRDGGTQDPFGVD
jgi:uncharacterized protein (TIGR03437 family)